jgi:hypothetical protein
MTAESAGCEALRAERPVDEIRSPLLPGAKRPATTVSSAGAVFCAPLKEQGWIFILTFITSNISITVLQYF